LVALGDLEPLEYSRGARMSSGALFVLLLAFSSRFPPNRTKQVHLFL